MQTSEKKTDSSQRRENVSRVVLADLRMQRDQRRLRPRVRSVQKKAPAELARERTHAVALRLETAAVGFARCLGAPEDFVRVHVAPLEPCAAAEGKILFRGIDDLHEMPAKTTARDVTEDVAITPAIMEDFVHYASEKDIAPVADIREALQKPNDRNFIERALKAEIIAAKFGFDASYPYRLQGDNQIAKAIEVLPESQKLAEKAAALHSVPGANSSDAGTRAAQALPHGK